jgi:Bacterial Ig-like domain/Pseudomurein-binding repeat
LISLNFGGGNIKSKLLFSVLLLFGLAIILNVSTASACNITTLNSTPKITAVDPVNKAIVLNTKVIKIKFNTPIKYGNKLMQLKSTTNGKFVPIKTSINGDTLSIIPTTSLTKGFRYQILIHSGSVENLSGNGVNISSTSFMISPITLSQMKDGLNRAQKFYNTNNRLPNYVSYGTLKIPIEGFQQIIAYQGMKINVFTGVRSVYITSDNINNVCSDNGRINTIVGILKTMGIQAYNMGLGPNSHMNVLESSSVDKNALIVDIYCGADAGLIKEMGSSFYKNLKGTKKVFSIFWPPAQVITGLAFLQRSHDDNYDPPSFTGLAHPDQYLKCNGYSYIYSNVISTIVNNISYQSKH